MRPSASTPSACSCGCRSSCAIPTASGSGAAHCRRRCTCSPGCSGARGLGVARARSMRRAAARRSRPPLARRGRTRAARWLDAARPDRRRLARALGAALRVGAQHAAREAPGAGLRERAARHARRGPRGERPAAAPQRPRRCFPSRRRFVAARGGEVRLGSRGARDRPAEDGFRLEPGPGRFDAVVVAAPPRPARIARAAFEPVLPSARRDRRLRARTDLHRLPAVPRRACRCRVPDARDAGQRGSRSGPSTAARSSGQPRPHRRRAERRGAHER